MKQPGSGPTILIADDVRDNRDLYAMFLEFHGYRIEVASDGREAIDKAVAQRPAVIVMDLTMPDIDGWTACRRLKDDPRTAGIPIIVLTAHALEGTEARAKAAGCNAYLVKPCLPDNLLAEVERQLTRSV